jgi:hypothetical protein
MDSRGDHRRLARRVRSSPASLVPLWPARRPAGWLEGVVEATGPGPAGLLLVQLLAEAECAQCTVRHVVRHVLLLLLLLLLLVLVQLDQVQVARELLHRVAARMGGAPGAVLVGGGHGAHPPVLRPLALGQQLCQLRLS